MPLPLKKDNDHKSKLAEALKQNLKKRKKFKKKFKIKNK
tara:strand:+ start:520 stop:636 length:117 start_codon:yes stop_codon:yes gene_type:complete